MFPARYFAPLVGMVFALTIVLTFTNTLLTSAADALSSSAGSDSLTIFSGVSTIPQTGIIPATLIDRIGGLKGVESISPEALSLVSVNDNILFLRGVDMQLFGSLTNLRLLEGVSELGQGKALVGVRAGRLLKVHAGDRLLAKSALAQRSASFSVTGIFETGEVFDDEIVTTVPSARFLRGLADNTFSLIRVKVASPEARSEVLRVLGVEKRERVPENRGFMFPFSVSSYLPPSAQSAVREAIQASSPEQIAENAIGRGVAVSRTLLCVLTIVVMASSIFTLYHAVSLFHVKASPIIATMRSIGATQRRILSVICLHFSVLAVPAALAGFSTGYSIAIIASQLGLWRILFHTIIPHMDASLFVYSTLLPVVFTEMLVWICSVDRFKRVS